MKLEWIYVLVSFLTLLFVQVLVCNHIHILGYATPLLFAYFPLSARRGAPKWLILLLCFALGMGVDVFANTPGVAAASMTLMGFIQPYVLEAFVSNDDTEDLKPTFRTLGTSKYLLYSSILIVVHNIAFYAIEVFNFFNTVQWLISFGASTILTLLLVWVIENLRRNK